MNIKELEERIKTLEHNQRELVLILKQAGLLRFGTTQSPYAPRQTPR